MTPRRGAHTDIARPSGTEFATRVFAAVSRIPAGQVATYGDVARLAGRPRAPRAVGRLMHNAARPGLPYHRVVAAGGRIGGYGASGATMKAGLLEAEGIATRKGRIMNFDQVRIDTQRRASASTGRRRRSG